MDLDLISVSGRFSKMTLLLTDHEPGAFVYFSATHKGIHCTHKVRCMKNDTAERSCVNKGCLVIITFTRIFCLVVCKWGTDGVEATLPRMVITISQGCSLLMHACSLGRLLFIEQLYSV